MLLVELALLCQGVSPLKHAVEFADELSAVFTKEQNHTLQVASRLLRDDRMFQAVGGKSSEIWYSMFPHCFPGAPIPT